MGIARELAYPLTGGGSFFWRVTANDLDTVDYATTIEANRWYSIEISRITGVNGGYSFWVNDTLINSKTVETTNNADIVDIGLEWLQSTTAFIDSVVIADTRIGMAEFVGELSPITRQTRGLGV